MRKPWNIIDTPVYSLATYNEGRLNMNICTYVSAISRKPKMYIISIEALSKTFDNLERSKVCVLQLLTNAQIQLVQILGKKSGFIFRKEEYLKSRDLIVDWQGYSVLPNCAAYLLLTKIDQKTAGDHTLFTFNVAKSKTRSEGNILMFQNLIDHKVILG